MCHDVKDKVIGDLHTVVPNAGEVADSTVNIVFYNAFGGVRVGVLHRQIGTEDSRRHATGDLQCTAWFSTIANHTRYIGNHILDSVGNLLVVSAHEIGDTCRGTCSR